MTAEDSIPLLDENVGAFYARYGRAPGAELHDEPGLTWYATGIHDSFFNGVARASLSPESAADRIGAVATVFRARGLPWQWNIGSRPQPADLAQRLASLDPDSVIPLTGMAMSLKSLRSAPAVPVLTVEPVRDHDALSEWIRIGTSVFGMNDADAILAVEAGLGAAPDLPWQRFLARLDGAPVGTALVFLTGGTAGIYWVSSLPDVRGRGIGTALTLAALSHARKRGATLAVLQASGVGLKIYRRLGFREVSRNALVVWRDGGRTETADERG